MEILIPETLPKTEVTHYSRHKNSISSNFSSDNASHLTNITNNISLSFLDSKNQSPTNASSHDLPNLQKAFISQAPQPFPEDKIMADYQRYDFPEYQNYKDYMNTLENQDNRNLYDDNVNFNDDLSYNTNSNLFNFDEYFTVN